MNKKTPTIQTHQEETHQEETHPEKREQKTLGGKVKKFVNYVGRNVASALGIKRYIQTPNGLIEVTQDENNDYTIETMPNEKYKKVYTHLGKIYVGKMVNGKLKKGLLNSKGDGVELPVIYDYNGAIHSCGDGKYITIINGNKGVSGKGGKEIIPHQYKDIKRLVTGKHYAVKGKDRRSVIDENNNTIIEGEYTKISSKKLNGIGNVFIAEDSQGEVLVTKSDGTTLIDHIKIIKKGIDLKEYRIYAFDGHLIYETKEGGKDIMILHQDGKEPIKLYNANASYYVKPSNKSPFKAVIDEIMLGIASEEIDPSRIEIKSFSLTPKGNKYKNKNGFTAAEIEAIRNKNKEN